MKHLLTALLLLNSLSATAADISISNLGRWRLSGLSQKNMLTGNAQIILTLPGRRNDYIPTVLVENLPAEAAPTTIEEWRLLLNIPEKEALDQLIKADRRTRYIVEFKKDVGAETRLHSLFMAEVVDGRIYLLSFQNHPKTYEANVRKVRELFNRIKLVDTRPRKI